MFPNADVEILEICCNFVFSTKFQIVDLYQR